VQKNNKKTHYGRGKKGEGQVGVALIMQNKERSKKNTTGWENKLKAPKK